MHAGGQEPLESLLKRLNELRREYGRERVPFGVHVISLDAYHRGANSRRRYGRTRPNDSPTGCAESA